MKNNANETGNSPVISRGKAEELAGKYLKETFYKYDKIIFQGCEELQTGEQTIFRFSGVIVDKTQSLLDRLSRDKSAVTYKFIVEVDAQTSKILNYFLN